jgi:hypothetical protein
MDSFVSQWNTDRKICYGMLRITMGMNPDVVFR